MFFGKVSVVDRRYFASFDFFDVAAFTDPLRAQRRQALFDVAIETRIAPRTAGVVNADRFVYFDLAVHRLRRRERDFAERDADVGMQFAGDENLFGIR